MSDTVNCNSLLDYRSAYSCVCWEKKVLDFEFMKIKLTN